MIAFSHRFIYPVSIFFLCLINSFSISSQTFVEQNGVNNPMNGEDVGSRASPSLIDIDKDGDYDLFIGMDNGMIKYYENIGTSTSPTYIEKFGSDNPLNGVDVGDNTNIGFVDIDNDGDFDAFLGEREGVFNFYENIGNETIPIFSLFAEASNPLSGFMTTGSGNNDNSQPNFVDLDNDGDWDLISGEGDGTFRYYENIGTASSASFIEQSGSSNPFEGFDVGRHSSPSFVDFDNDGDFDLFSGEGDGSINYYENNGTSSMPLFVLQSGVNNPFDGVDIGTNAQITFNDLNGDGYADGIFGEQRGSVNYFTGLNVGFTPLPIELIYFNVFNQDNNVLIEWSTASETNNDFFTVERSVNAIEWEEIIFIEGAGKSTDVLEYSVIDEELFFGTVYYRLKQTDFNGEYKYSKIVKLQQKAAGNLVRLYPNPTAGSVIIETKGLVLNEIEIFDNYGRDITNSIKISIVENGKAHIDLTGVERGMYFIKTKNVVSKVFKK